MEVRHSLHQRQVEDALDSGGSLDGGNEPMEKGTEVGSFVRSHFAEVQQMTPRLDDDRSCASPLQRGVVDEVVLIFDDLAIWAGGVEEL